MKECIFIAFLVINFGIKRIDTNVTVVSEDNDFSLPDDGYFLDDLNEIGLGSLG